LRTAKIRFPFFSPPSLLFPFLRSFELMEGLEEQAVVERKCLLPFFSFFFLFLFFPSTWIEQEGRESFHPSPYRKSLLQRETKGHRSTTLPFLSDVDLGVISSIDDLQFSSLFFFFPPPFPSSVR